MAKAQQSVLALQMRLFLLYAKVQGNGGCDETSGDFGTGGLD